MDRRIWLIATNFGAPFFLVFGLILILRFPMQAAGQDHDTITKPQPTFDNICNRSCSSLNGIISDTLIGYYWDGNNEKIISIEPTLGVTSVISTLDLDWVSFDRFAVDSINHMSYLAGQKNEEPNWRLYTTDLKTGQVVSSTILDIGKGGFGFKSYDVDTLIGYYWDGNNEKIISIDATTGVTSVIATLDLDWVSFDRFAVDPINHKSYLAGQKNEEPFWRLYTTDLKSGQTVSSTILDMGKGGFGFDIYLPPTPIIGLISSNNGPTIAGEATTLTATITTGRYVYFTWLFGDGGIGNGAVVSHIYPKVGVFTAVVTASNSMYSLSTSTVITVEQPIWHILLPIVVTPIDRNNHSLPPNLSRNRTIEVLAQNAQDR